jgi:hypothetical protein
MTPLDQAVAVFEKRLSDAGVGSMSAPKDESTEWFVMHADAVGLSFLRRCRQLYNDPAALESFYRRFTRELKE